MLDSESFELINPFIIEARENLDGMARLLLDLESEITNTKYVDDLFRLIHSVKGASGMFELIDVMNLSHQMENLLGKVRSSEFEIDNNIIDVLLNGCDLIQVLFNELEYNINNDSELGRTEGDDRVKEVIEKIKFILEGEKEYPEEDKGEFLDKIEEKYISDFKLQSNKHIETIEKELLKISDKKEYEEAINELFRAIHTIKGEAGYLGLIKIEDFAHSFESLVDIFRKERDKIDEPVLDLFFEAIDILKQLIESIGEASGGHNSSEIKKKLLKEFKRLSGKEIKSREVLKENLESSKETIFYESAKQYIDVIFACIDKTLSDGAFDKSNISILTRNLDSLESSSRYEKQDDISRTIQEVKSIISAMDSGELEYDEKVIDFVKTNLSHIKYIIEINSVKPKETNEKYSDDNEPCEKSPKLSNPEEEEKVDGENGNKKEKNNKTVPPGNKTMRIEESILDVFMNSVGELIVARNSFSHLGHKFKSKGTDQSVDVEFQKVTQEIGRISEDLQYNVMKMRMVTFKTVFQKVPRMLRDITRKNKKLVDLLIEGEETEIDKSIAEEIVDPLVHLVRNAVDHGIESPEIRKKTGKKETGTLKLHACREGNLIVIEIIDDGKGIDPEKILAKAIKTGLTSEEKAKSLSENEILNFIFAPGFSMAEKITDISGRGVGMDVVNSNIKKIKGSVRIFSEPGKGSKFRLEVPLTMAVVRALLVAEGSDTYAIPIETITETVKIPAHELKPLMKKKGITLRGEIIGVEFLSKILGKANNCSYHRKASDTISILVLKSGARRLGIVVDRIYRQEKIVIKPLIDYLAVIPGLAGATILGDGSAILILDVPQIIGMACSKAYEEKKKKCSGKNFDDKTMSLAA